MGQWVMGQMVQQIGTGYTGHESVPVTHRPHRWNLSIFSYFCLLIKISQVWRRKSDGRYQAVYCIESR